MNKYKTTRVRSNFSLGDMPMKKQQKMPDIQEKQNVYEQLSRHYEQVLSQLKEGMNIENVSLLCYNDIFRELSKLRINIQKEKLIKFPSIDSKNHLIPVYEESDSQSDNQAKSIEKKKKKKKAQQIFDSSSSDSMEEQVQQVQQSQQPQNESQLANPKQELDDQEKIEQEKEKKQVRRNAIKQNDFIDKYKFLENGDLQGDNKDKKNDRKSITSEKKIFLTAPKISQTQDQIILQQQTINKSQQTRLSKFKSPYLQMVKPLKPQNQNLIEEDVDNKVRSKSEVKSRSNQFLNELALRGLRIRNIQQQSFNLNNLIEDCKINQKKTKNEMQYLSSLDLLSSSIQQESNVMLQDGLQEDEIFDYVYKQEAIESYRQEREYNKKDVKVIIKSLKHAFKNKII